MRDVEIQRMTREFITVPLRELGIYDDLKGALKKTGITHVTGLTDPARPVFSCAVTDGVRLIIASDETRAREIMETAFLFSRDVYYFPPRDMMFYQADLSGNQLMRQRMQVFKALHDDIECVIVTTFDALMEKMVPPSLISEHILTFKVGDILDAGELSATLSDLGYEREPEAEEPGRFAIRGGIIDIYPLTEENPFRIELWGDEIESIREYDALSQRSVEKLESVEIYPATDLIMDRDTRLKAKDRIEKESKQLRQLHGLFRG